MIRVIEEVEMAEVVEWVDEIYNPRFSWYHVRWR